MMCFGWRPHQSCYKTPDQAGTCPPVTWFYVLAALAVVAGVGAKK